MESHIDPELDRYVRNWTCYKSPFWIYWLCYAVAVIVTFSNLCILVFNIIQLFFKKEVKLDKFIKQKSSKCIYILIITLYSLGPFLLIIALTVQMTCVLPQNEDGIYIFFMILLSAIQTMTIATEILYLFFVLRLKALFQAIPQLKVNVYIFRILVMAFGATLVCQFVSIGYYIHDLNGFMGALKWGYIALSINALFSFILLFVFIFHEYKLLKYIRSDTESGAQKKMRIVDFSIRYLWIAVIAMMSTNVVNVVNVILATHQTMSLQFIKNILVIIDAFINMLCLYLQFEFADKLYFRLCRVCHVKWVNCFGDLNDDNEQSLAKHINSTEMIVRRQKEPTKTTSESPVDSNDVPQLQRDDVSKKEEAHSSRTLSDRLLNIDQ